MPPLKLTGLFCLVLALLLLVATGAYAATASGAAGDVELRLLERIFTGNIGLTLGLIVAVFGIFSIVNGKMAGGIILIILGVIITLLPGVYNGIRVISCPIAESLGGKCGGS